MTQKKYQKPTEAELEILQVLWEEGPSTVRLVNEIQNKKKTIVYTTTLKLLQIMMEKGLVKRDEESRTHIYRPLVDKKQTQALLLDKFLTNTFSGSAHKMVMQALGNHRTSKDELGQIRKLIDEIEEKEHDDGTE